MENLFITAGSNGAINFWDIKKKNTLGQINVNSPVNCFDFCPSGNGVVFGIGNDWCLGMNGLGT